MLNPNALVMIGELEKLLRNDIITPSKKVDPDSFLCLAQMAGSMVVGYVQVHIAQLAERDQKLLLDKVKGDVIGDTKIIGIFDIWS